MSRDLENARLHAHHPNILHESNDGCLSHIEPMAFRMRKFDEIKDITIWLHPNGHKVSVEQHMNDEMTAKIKRKTVNILFGMQIWWYVVLVQIFCPFKDSCSAENAFHTLWISCISTRNRIIRPHCWHSSTVMWKAKATQNINLWRLIKPNGKCRKANADTVDR